MENNKNIIAAYLLDGELAQRLAIVPDEHIPKRNAMIEAQEALEEVLTDNQQPLFDKYHDSVMEYRDSMEQHHFTEGFKAGLLFGLQTKGQPISIDEK